MNLTPQLPKDKNQKELAESPMSTPPIDATLLAQTKEILDKRSTRFADYFYEELLHHPTDFANAFRNTDLTKQKEMLREGMSQILALSANTEALRSYLRELGIRHLCYEVKEEHYPVVKEVLLKSVKHVHEKEWNQDYEALWQALTSTMTEHMIAGCRWNSEASRHGT